MSGARRSSRAEAAALGAAAAAGALGLCLSPAAVAAAWRDAGALATARAGHTITLLRDGTALVTGGRISVLDSTRSAEVFDPGAAGSARRVADLRAAALSARRVRLSFSAPVAWRATGSMRVGRSAHTATRLADGRVLVAGGRARDGAPTASAEVYDPARGTWAAVAPMRAPRASHTATLLPDGSVLVAGGRGGDGDALASAERYHPDQRVWSPAAPMAVARLHHTATRLPDGRVLAAGGHSRRDPTRAPGFLPTIAVEIYDPADGTWSAGACPEAPPAPDQPSPCLHVPRARHSATLLADGRVLVAGGVDDSDAPRRSAEAFEPATTAWTATASMAVGRSEHTADLLPDGRLLVAGGRGVGPATAELHDPALSTWAPADPLRAGRREHASIVLGGARCGARCGSVLLTGGAAEAGALPGQTTLLRTAELFVPGEAAADDPLVGAYIVKQSRRPIRDPSSFRRARLLCGGACGFRLSGDRLTLTVTDLRPDTTYYYALAAATDGGRVRIVSTPARVRTRRDTRAPGRVTGLSGTRIAVTTVRLSFRASGDDGRHPPPARRYIIKQSPRAITDAQSFARARTLCGRCRFAPRRVGDRITLTVTALRPRARYHYAVRARDGVGNLGPLSASVRVGPIGR